MKLLLPVIAVAVIMAIIYLIYVCFYYRRTSYYKNTHASFLSVLFDTGKYGEYLTYCKLQDCEKNGGQFLFNTYLPKNSDQDVTTEVDLILIHPSGIYVFESKNYSGWIFGDDKQKTWTQCLPQGKGRSSRKEHFLNPIFQNKLHISSLKKILGDAYPYMSMIVFSERCTLKNIIVSDPLVSVVNRQHLHRKFEQFAKASALRISQEEIDRLYQMLYPYTQVNKAVKEKHIENIHEKLIAEEAAKEAKQKSTTETPSTEKVVAPKQETRKQEASPEKDIPEGSLICPRCGGTLVLRTSTRGETKGKQFYGCSNYPHCHYVKNI